MSGWLVAKAFETRADVPTLETLFAVWHGNRNEARRLAKSRGRRGSRINPRIITELNESVLRGLNFRAGESVPLSADNR